MGNSTRAQFQESVADIQMPSGQILQIKVMKPLGPSKEPVKCHKCGHIGPHVQKLGVIICGKCRVIITI